MRHQKNKTTSEGTLARFGVNKRLGEIAAYTAVRTVAIHGLIRAVQRAFLGSVTTRARTAQLGILVLFGAVAHTGVLELTSICRCTILHASAI